ncbi:hypothetical protein JN11_04643 [Mucilaginibacter frigoritolerans]|uniref:Fibronectin type-III domain-containing protein n=1 Tax=Mucilaginibacter frigoritolerans TaxID=652788 RepID=A0A562TMC5_9SPHI|nr:hypothetical protein [Mucilaginibacter frigoritolerans]TWI94533.1 hypothetical protein JN11_04643 [Mucilaginibacter frigoritolerans]
MKLRPLLYLLPILFAGINLLSSCDDIIEPSISKSIVNPEAPANQYVSTNYNINFWWDPVNHALTYHLQVVTPTFAAPGNLILDTVIAANKFSFTMSPGNYQWRVMAENGSSQTAYSTPKSFTIALSSITQQTVLLNAPANNSLTNQSSTTFQWGSLYGATQYRLEIDTNNFANANSLVLNQAYSGQQVNFTFPKNQAYQWRVRAENDTAQSQWSAINIVTFDNIPPAAPTLISPANAATVSLPVSLQWNASATAVKYKVYIFQSDSVTLYNSSFPVQVTTTSYSFNLGTSGSKVYWKVTAFDAAGNESAASTLNNFVLQ